MSTEPTYTSYLSMFTSWVQGSTRRLLASVTIVDYTGAVVLDTYVEPTEDVTNYRTLIHGLELTHLSGHPGARRFEVVKEAVRAQIAGKIIIGHCLWDSFDLLQLSHPACDTRDVATFAPFRRTLGYPLNEDVSSPDDCPSLKEVMLQVMRRHIRLGYDSTSENARACIDLFRSVEDVWEGEISKNRWPCILLNSPLLRCYT